KGLVPSRDNAMAPPVIEAVRAWEVETVAPRNQVNIAQATVTAKPTIVTNNSVFPVGPRATKSAAKNWTVPTPKIATTMRISDVIDNAVTGVSAPDDMGRATAFGVSLPATTKIKTAASMTATMNSNSVLTRNHAPEFVQAAWRIRGL